ncbi:MAG: SpoIIE family protein phosphatase [Pseudomonadota bacterium]
MDSLYMIKGPLEGQSFHLKEDKTLVGRAVGNDVQIKDPSVSRKHVEIIRRAGQYFLMDLQSQNGTWVNGQLIRSGVEIKVDRGHPISIGNNLLSIGRKIDPDDTTSQYSISFLEGIEDPKEGQSSKDRYIKDHKRLELMYRVSSTLMQSLELNDIVVKIMDSLFDSLERIDAGCILLIDEKTGGLKEVIARSRDRKEGFKMDFSETVVERVIREGKAIMKSAGGSRPQPEFSASNEMMGVRSYMCVPLISKSRPQGVIYVHSLNAENEFQKDDLFLLAALSTPVALAIENALLYLKRMDDEATLRDAQKELERRVEERTTELAKANSELRGRSRDLNMRVRQVYCLYAISSLQGRANSPLESVISGIVDRIPPAWQYPEITRARVIWGDRHFSSKGFKESPWKLSQDITLDGRNAGVVEVYYLEKKPEAGVGPFLREERTLLKVIADRLGETIERKRTEEALARAREKEVEIGSRIQKTLLFGTPPRNIAGLQISSLTIPSQRIDGDFYDFFRHTRWCMDLIVGDVMGKGVPAALLGAGTKTQFLRAVSNLVAASDRLPAPEDIVQLAHNRLVKELIKLESFVTLCYARIEMKERRVFLVHCGHTRSIHYQANTRTCKTLEGPNVPFGFREEEIYKQIQFSVEPGDALFFYSDGITEAQNRKGEFFEETRLAECVRKNGHLSPPNLINKVLAAAVAFSQSEAFPDDLTCVALKIEEEKKIENLGRSVIELSSDLTELEKLRDFIMHFCEEKLQPPEEDQWVWQLDLAVDEAVANVIKHANRGLKGKRLQVEADLFTDRIEVRINHWGEVFKPPEFVKPPPLEKLQESGYGLFLIESSVDEVTYGRDDEGKSSICMVKYRNRIS